MTWRVANSLLKLREQVNAKWPARSKDSDGTIGDAGHSSRESDHNPNPDGVVCAMDLTHDPAHGFNSYTFAEMLLKRQDARIKYAISNRRIGSGPAGPSPGVWRPYHGPSPHDHHCHISVMGDRAHYDNASDWSIDGMPVVVDKTFVAPPPTVIPGSTGIDVQRLQTMLGCKVTGLYAAGSETEFALRLYQVRHGLVPDGRAGPATWAALTAGSST
jgi:hypothetical protein